MRLSLTTTVSRAKAVLQPHAESPYKVTFDTLPAGTEPGAHVYPAVMEAMKERGLDLSGAQPQKLTTELAMGAAFLVTMGCGESCPLIPGVPVFDWPLDDPKGQGIDTVRAIRDEIEMRVRAFVTERAWARA